jgi:CRP-like cAMP-binding protein
MTITGEVQSLQKVPMFRDVDAGKLKLLAFTSDRLTYSPGDVLFRQHDVSDAAYVVLDGEVDVVLESAPQPITVAHLTAGALVGEMGVLCDSARTATVVAATNVVALRIEKDTFFDMLREFPQMTIAVMRDLARRLEQTNARLAARARADGARSRTPARTGTR